MRWLMSVLPPKADKYGHVRMSASCQKRTYAPQQKSHYSITSSACASSVGGTSRPTAFAIIWSETVTLTRPVGLDHYES
jgi:hypothetical protein